MKPTCAVRVCTLAILAALAAFSGAAYGQLRITTWNVTSYSSGRVTAFQTSIYDEFEGRSMSPDILIGQEFLSASGVTNFLNLLNGAPDSPGDWAAAPFIDGRDTDSAFFYRTSKATFLGVTTVSVGGLSPDPPRDVRRYDFRLVGYDSVGATLACYSTHMKAGTSGDDQARRLVEAQLIRDNAEGVDTYGPGSGLPAGYNFLLGGDLNVQTSSQAAYVELIGSQANNDGRFFDPISTPGSWNNNGYFRFVHTQDPTGAGGMDDRHDQLLVSASLVDGDGFDYIGDPATPYSTSTWDDANHSHRSWGNDGTSYNTELTVSGNTMVGATIAQALKDSALGGGHLPVFFDLRVPPRIDSDDVIDFGEVFQGDPADEVLTVWNDGDVALWTTDGIADLSYSISASAGFTAPGGTFVESPGGAANEHVIVMDTSTTGSMVGTLTIFSNAPDEPSRIVTLLGEVLPSTCFGDLDGDDDVDLADLAILLAHYGTTSGAGYADGDLDGDGDVDVADLAQLLAVYGTTCP
jgi:hypothetical protein